ncbi:MAG: methyltransferase domain-containing protein, partial [Deltaproteobacteria bacterium]|nr:methyltransferase domain-containing protein [Deltaproteobacteria bacterium]
PAVISQSHAFLDAFDRRELATFDAMLGPTFVRFVRARFYDGPYYKKTLAAQLERKVPPASRACTDEKVYRAANVVTYMGSCTVRTAAFGEMPQVILDGWESVVWVPDGDTWKVALWQWTRAGLEAEREDWNETYRTAIHFKRDVNAFLARVIKGRKPGTALDIAMGQGRNALHLAAKQWRVTGVDISDEGIRIAKEAAAQQKVKLVTVEQDLEKYDFGTARWDLVTMIYAGGDAARIEKVKTSLRKGGLFVVEFFHRDSTTGTGIGGFATGELAKQFAGWKILVDEVVEDTADWGLRKAKLVRFAAEKP